MGNQNKKLFLTVPIFKTMKKEYCLPIIRLIYQLWLLIF